MQPRIFSGFAAALFAVSFVAAPALAHHGWGGQAEQQIEVTGKVHKPVSLAGPHATLQLIADGQVWDVTLAPAARTESAGLKPGTLAVGDSITVRGNRNSDARRFEIKTVRVSSAGKTFDVYPDRIK